MVVYIYQCVMVSVQGGQVMLKLLEGNSKTFSNSRQKEGGYTMWSTQQVNWEEADVE